MQVVSKSGTEATSWSTSMVISVHPRITASARDAAASSPCPRAADGTQPQILLKLEVPSVLSTGLRFLFNIYREIVVSPARTAGRRSRRDVLGDVFGVSSHTPDQGGG